MAVKNPEPFNVFGHSTYNAVRAAAEGMWAYLINFLIVRPTYIRPSTKNKKMSKFQT